MTDQTTRLPVRRALISVSDKTGILEFARELQQLGVEILSTGGTYKLLKDNGVDAVEVADYTGFAEMMDGRVKTLHPKIHGGILGRRGTDDAIMSEHGIKPIDLVAVNLYPFEATISKPGCDLPTAIENIDIGGPTMVRSAAKNHRTWPSWSTPATTPASSKASAGGLTYAQRFDLMLKAFEHTAAYDGMIANYMGTIDQASRPCRRLRSEFPRTFNSQFVKAQEMRWREPAPERGVLRKAKKGEASISTAVQLQARTVVQQRGRHRRRAGVREELRQAGLRHRQARQPVWRGRVPEDEGGIRKAYDLAYATDTESAFGGIAFNRELDGETAKAIVERQFVEVIIAPKISQAARDVVAASRTCACWNAAVASRALRAGTSSVSTADCWCKAVISA